MFALADDCTPSPKSAPSALATELALILDMRARLIESGELRHCSVLNRRLIEDEIPRLMGLIGRR